ncbi:MAG: hypothetical protein SFX74_00955 [Fimbriimonadaceae bacterium]|nr:hypothetical protein [Fimbriimonadaceae bacterium]
MASLLGDLWQHNLIQVIVVDVTQDYQADTAANIDLLPAAYYPELYRTVIPAYRLNRTIEAEFSDETFAYDWHELPIDPYGPWYVGVVQKERVAPV